MRWAAALCACVVLAGCGGGSKRDGAQTPGSAPTSVSTPVAPTPGTPAVIATATAGTPGTPAAAPTGARSPAATPVAATGLSGDDAAAAAYAAELYRQVFDGEWNSLYESLHPDQRSEIDQADFVRCSVKEAPALPKLDDVTVTGVTDGQVDVPGIPQHDAKRVALVLTSGDRQDPTVLQTIKVDGKWTWFLEKAAMDAYGAGKCPG